MVWGADFADKQEENDVVVKDFGSFLHVRLHVSSCSPEPCIAKPATLAPLPKRAADGTARYVVSLRGLLASSLPRPSPFLIAGWQIVQGENVEITLADRDGDILARFSFEKADIFHASNQPEPVVKKDNCVIS